MGSTAAIGVALALGLAGCATAPAPPRPLDPVVTPPTLVTTSPTTTAPPDPAIVELINGAGMTPSGRVIFLASHPALEDKATVEAACSGAAEADPQVFQVLGCLARGRIHIRLPAAPELHDLIYVVAAHELLHAVYAGLETAERQRLDVDLDAARAANPVIDEHVKFYRAVSVETESHSLAGTEVAEISAALEVHYAKYIDRGRVLAAYRRTLGDRDDELRQLQASVDESSARLDAMRADIDALRSAGDTRGANAVVAQFNPLVRQHNAVVSELNAKLEARNQLLRS